jgi:hypothetical protein
MAATLLELARAVLIVAVLFVVVGAWTLLLVWASDQTNEEG